MKHALLLIEKIELDFITEFIKFYLLEFEHIFIYDLNTENQPLSFENVTFYRWSEGMEKARQHFLSNHLSDIEWLFLPQQDEYLYLVDSLTEFISDDCPGYQIPIKKFKSSQPKTSFLIDNFIWHYPYVEEPGRNLINIRLLENKDCFSSSLKLKPPLPENSTKDYDKYNYYLCKFYDNNFDSKNLILDLNLRNKYSLKLKQSYGLKYQKLERSFKYDREVVRKFHGDISSEEEQDLMEKGELIYSKSQLEFIMLKYPYVYSDVYSERDFILDKHSQIHLEYYPIPYDLDWNYLLLFLDVNQSDPHFYTKIRNYLLKRKLMNLHYNYKLPKDFSPRKYKNKYEDLKHLSLKRACIHYVHYGISEGREYPVTYTKTVPGDNGYLFLESELEQHYNPFYYTSFDISEIRAKLDKYNILNKYNLKIFSVPDKSVICQKYTDCKGEKLFRIVEHLPEVIDLQPFFEEKDYLITDTHITEEGKIKLAKKIIDIVENVQVNVDYDLTEDDLEGDLTRKYNTDLTFDTERVKFAEFSKTNLIDLTYLLPFKERFHRDYMVLFVGNKKPIISKKILILGASTCEIALLNFFNMVYEEVLFYRDCWYIHTEIIEKYKPDRIFMIRPERFFSMGTLLEKLEVHLCRHEFTDEENIDTKLLTEREIIKVLTYAEQSICRNFWHVDDLENREFISQMLYRKFDVDKILSYPEMDEEMNIIDILNLYPKILNEFMDKDLIIQNDLVIGFPKDSLTPISVKNFIITKYLNKKEDIKLRIQNIPIDFDSQVYQSLNEDLTGLNNRELMAHYEFNGFFEGRVYK